MFISKAKQHVVIMGFAVALITALLICWYLPTRRQHRLITQKNVSLNTLISQAKLKQQKLPQMEEELNRMEKTLQSYDSALPYDTQLGDFLGKVASLMDAHGLTGQQISPQKQIKAEKLSCITVDMKCKGRLSQIRKFYSDIQQLDRTVRIEEFRLVNDSDMTGNINMETKVVIYFRGKQV